LFPISLDGDLRNKASVAVAFVLAQMQEQPAASDKGVERGGCTHCSRAIAWNFVRCDYTSKPNLSPILEQDCRPAARALSVRNNAQRRTATPIKSAMLFGSRGKSGRQCQQDRSDKMPSRGLAPHFPDLPVAGEIKGLKRAIMGRKVGYGFTVQRRRHKKEILDFSGLWLSRSAMEYGGRRDWISRAERG
jgi:hypothetical protein